MKKLKEKLLDAFVAVFIGFLIALMSQFIDILKGLQHIPLGETVAAVTTTATYMLKSWSRYT